MNELVPISAGIVAGLIALRFASMRLRTLVLVALSVAFGVGATIVTGEALVSWEFILVDIPLTFLAGVAAITVASWVRRALPQLR